MFDWLTKSKGWKRALSIIFLSAAGLPDLAEYAGILNALGQLLGVVGVGHAVIAKKK